jgi:coenzyme PQQ precursor peptide PqqA
VFLSEDLKCCEPGFAGANDSAASARDFSPTARTQVLAIFSALHRQANDRPTQGGNEMTWKTPKIVEIAVGLEINMYACAVRK